MNLSKNTILITGGSTGIGLELAKQLTLKGNTVIVTGRDQKKLDLAKSALPKIHTYQSDVSDSKAILTLYSAVTEKFPDLNILINNAGIMRTINLHDTSGTLDNLSQEIEINLMGPIHMVKQFLPHLKKKSTAAIVNVTSGLAFTPLPTSPVYSCAKAGLHSYTQSLRVQLKNTSIKVFELAPPVTETALLGDFDLEDMKGITIMKLDAMVAVAMAGFEKDQLEIRPGQSNQLKFMSRLAPQFILNQMSKPVDRMLISMND